MGTDRRPIYGKRAKNVSRAAKVRASTKTRRTTMARRETKATGAAKDKRGNQASSNQKKE